MVLRMALHKGILFAYLCNDALRWQGTSRNEKGNDRVGWQGEEMDWGGDGLGRTQIGEDTDWGGGGMVSMKALLSVPVLMKHHL